MKVFKLSIIIVSFCIMSVSSAHAQWVVTDPGNTLVNTISQIKNTIFQTWDQVKSEYNWAIQAYNQGEMILHQIEQIQNQYQQIQQMATALHGLDTNSFNTLKSSLQDNYYKSETLFNSMRGMNDNVAAVQAKFESTYPKLEAMAQMDPAGWKTIVNTSTQAQRDNIYNAKLKAANIADMNKQLQTKLESMSDQNNNVQGLKEAAQLGNQISIQQQQLAMETNANLALMLKQNADNINNLQMLQQAMQLEASKTFAYTKTPATTQGAGIYQIK